MAYAITQTCCTDASCIAACPVNCIHPTPNEPDFGTTEMLYVDPSTCIDCGACADACPVDAVFPVDRLTGSLRAYADINAAYYADRDAAVEPESGDAPETSGAPESGRASESGGRSEANGAGPNGVELNGPGAGSASGTSTAGNSPNFHSWGPPVFDHSIPSDLAPMDVAVVGTGPAGMYAVEDLLLHTNCRVTLLDRLPVAGGLVRYGVAPDHPSTKRISETFARFHNHPRMRLRLGVEVGKDVSAAELATRHDAVIYAVGASSARDIGVPGEELTGSVSATTLVSWYNGHPDAVAEAVDLSAERVVVVGNGNVALDVARILSTEPEQLADTSISPRALELLRSSRVREVVLLGRRGPEHAAFTRPELLELTQREDIELVVDTHDPRIESTIDAAGTDDKAGLLRDVSRQTVDWSTPAGDAAVNGRSRVVFRFHSAPVELVGENAVRCIRVGDAGGEAVEIPAGLVVRAVGYRGVPVPGLPFDEGTATVPNSGGRVTDRPGTYVVGWIKRGPSGGIGTNRSCAKETVEALLHDAVAGRLPEPSARVSGSGGPLARLRTKLSGKAGSIG
ncbi:ferredoxin--NADP+ reductase [Actinopolyspora mzabensis]|uniref:ferredoxin--NADP(+) reductase n=1 Tax=Actinopolyspora mzabensis TaxID=995066 RepID=A0A1G9EL14_ACTMZ|nr:FAD-dependent oxidoreductase [Actinopolyspora mzabensis]SDK76850.1 ferredoxin--NADP+ reductase [Actinopolyspora mzabensis]